MGKIIEGVWDCRYCETTQISGRERVCPVCGTNRDDKVSFYVANPKNYVSDDELKNINKQSDWICNYCNTLNNAKDNICFNCGAQKENSKDYLEAKTEEINTNNYSNYDFNQNTNNQKIKYNNYTENTTKADNNSEKQKNKKLKKIFIPLFLLPALIVALFISLLIPKEKEVMINGFDWERVVYTEEYKAVEENGWVLPSNARLISQKEEIKEYRQILSHYETKTKTITEEIITGYETVVTGHKDLGNGYFEEITEQKPIYETVTKTETYEEPVYRSEPVYATKYYYEIDKWMPSETFKTSGADKEPYYKDIVETNTYRIKSKSETYFVDTITTDKKKKEKKYEVSFDTWESLDLYKEVKFKVNTSDYATIIE